MSEQTPEIKTETTVQVRDRWIADCQQCWQENAELRLALANLLPYAIPTIGLPRESWPTDSVILRAEALLAQRKR